MVQIIIGCVIAHILVIVAMAALGYYFYKKNESKIVALQEEVKEKVLGIEGIVTEAKDKVVEVSGVIASIKETIDSIKGSIGKFPFSS